jgi:hypothetical protein
MFPTDIEVSGHNDARLPNVFAESRNVYNNNLTVEIMALCINHNVLTLYHPRNILFLTIILNSDVLSVPNILASLHIFANWRSHLTTLRILRPVANE